MIRKIARRRFLKEYPDFPIVSYYRNKYFFPDTYGHYILYVEAKSTIGLCKNIAGELLKLIRGLNYQQVVCLGDQSTPWLFREHYYKPVKEGLNYLVQKNASKSFNGAFQIDLTDLQEFLRNIFWLVRCNGIVFIPHFSDRDFNIIVSVCQYGNIHFSTLNETADLAFNNVIQQTALYISEDNKCHSFKIKHRISTRT